MRTLFVVWLAVLLVGCARFHNVTVDDIRASEYMRSEGTIPMGIPAIQQAMQNYSASCEKLGPLHLSPTNLGRAMYTVSMSNSPGSSIVLLIDLQQIGTTTRYQGYTYYKTAQSRLSNVIYAMSGGTDCRE